MPSPRKTYTRDFITSVLQIYDNSPIESYEEKLDTICRSYGVKRDVLERWIRNADSFEEAPLPENLSDVLTVLIDKLTRKIYESIEDGKGVRDYAVSLGILIDKKRLLDDKSTANHAQEIRITRNGPSTVPKHLTQRTITDSGGDVEIQRSELRETVGQDS